MTKPSDPLLEYESSDLRESVSVEKPARDYSATGWYAAGLGLGFVSLDVIFAALFGNGVSCPMVGVFLILFLIGSVVFTFSHGHSRGMQRRRVVGFQAAGLFTVLVPGGLFIFAGQLHNEAVLTAFAVFFYAATSLILPAACGLCLPKQ